MKNTLRVSVEAFTKLISGLIKSGVTFEAEEQAGGYILIRFTGGY